MPYEIPLFQPGGFRAAADYSSTGQFLAVKVTAAGVVTKCDTDGESIFGILQNDPKSGEEACVMVWGITKWIAAEALNVGDFVGTSNAGKATKVDHTTTGADAGDWIHGKVLEGTSGADEYATVVLVGPVGYRVTA